MKKLLAFLFSIFLASSVMAQPITYGTQVSDTAFSSSWNGILDIAPSKNAVYDQVQIVKAIGVWDGDYATYQLANTAAVAAGKTLFITLPWTLTANTTLTANVHVVKGGSFTKASTYTLTLNGGFQNPSNSQCFIGFTAGDVTFAIGKVREFLAEWWGGVGNDTTLNETPFANMIGAIPSTGGTIIVPSNHTYLFNNRITINGKANITLQGEGRSSRLHFVGVPILPSGDHGYIEISGSNTNGFLLENVAIEGDAPRAALGGQAPQPNNRGVVINATFDEIVIRGNHFSKVQGENILFSAGSAKMVLIEGNYFTDSSSTALASNAGLLGRTIISNNTMHALNGFGAEWSSDGVIFKGNHIYNIESSAFIPAQGNVSQTLPWLIVNNIIEDVNQNAQDSATIQAAIQLPSTTTPVNQVKVSDNIIRRVGGNGITILLTNQNNTIISDNFIVGFGTAGKESSVGTYFAGIYSSGTLGVVQNNIIIVDGGKPDYGVWANSATHVYKGNITYGTFNQGAFSGGGTTGTDNIDATLSQIGWLGGTLYGNLITNGEFTSNTTGWTNENATLTSVAGGQRGNCLEMTRTAATSQRAYQGSIKTIVGQLYQVIGYVKSGTSGDESFTIGIAKFGVETEDTVSNTTSGSWTKYSFIFEAHYGDVSIFLDKNTATAGTMLFDEIKIFRVSN